MAQSTDTQAQHAIAEITAETNLIVVPKKITTKAGFDDAAALYATIKGYEKGLELKRKAVTDPLNKALRTYNAMFKPLSTILATSKSDLQSKMNDYVIREEKKNDAKIEKIETALDAGTITPDKALDRIDRMAPVASSQAGVSVSTYDDIDITDASLIPMHYYTLDLPRLRRDVLGVKSGAGAVAGISVPGVSIVQRKRVV
jgi:hypothetical protein